MKKIISIILSLLFVVSSVSITAFADDEIIKGNLNDTVTYELNSNTKAITFSGTGNLKYQNYGAVAKSTLKSIFGNDLIGYNKAVVLSGITKIGTTNLLSIMPDVTQIYIYNDNLDGGFKYTDNQTIYANKNSTAYEYVAKNGGKFFALDENKLYTLYSNNQQMINLLPTDIEPGEYIDNCTTDQASQAHFDKNGYIYSALKKVVADITNGCKTDREKAIAICDWVYNHTLYDFGFHAVDGIEHLYYYMSYGAGIVDESQGDISTIFKTEQEVYNYFTTTKTIIAGNCSIYTAMYNSFCYLADLPTASIYVDEDTNAHEMSAVLISENGIKKWILVENTGGNFDYSLGSTRSIDIIKFSQPDGTNYQISKTDKKFELVSTVFTNPLCEYDETKTIIIPDWCEKIHENAIRVEDDYEYTQKKTFKISSKNPSKNSIVKYLAKYNVSFIVTDCEHNFECAKTKNATCKYQGYKQYECKKCGSYYRTTIAKIAHKYVTKNKKATYFEKGYKNRFVCSSCGKVKEKGITVAKLKLKTPKLKIKKANKKIRIAYKKVEGATGFQVQYKIGNKTVTKTFKTKKSVTKTLNKLKKGNYKVRLRCFTVKGKKKAYSNWTKFKKITIK